MGKSQAAAPPKTGDGDAADPPPDLQPTPVPTSTKATRHRSAWGGLGTWAPLAALLVVAAALRLWGLGRESLWLDEAYTWQTVRTPFAAMVAHLASRDLHPPFSFGVTWGLVRAFGDSEAVLRLAPALAGIATVAAVHAFAWDVAGPRAGFAAAALVALSPFHIHHSQDARPYALLALMAVLSMHAYWRLIASPAPSPASSPLSSPVTSPASSLTPARDAGDPASPVAGGAKASWRASHGAALAYGAATVALLYTHAAAVYLVAAQALHAAATWWLMPGARPRIARWLRSAAVVAALWLPWGLVTVRQALRFHEGFWIPVPELLALELSPEYSPGGALGQFFAGALPAATVLALAAVGWWGGGRRRPGSRGGPPKDRRGARSGSGPRGTSDRTVASSPLGPGSRRLAAWLLVAWVASSLLLPFLQSLVLQPVFLSRVALPAMPALAVLAALAAAPAGRRWVHLACSAVLACVAAAMLAASVAYHSELHNERWREAVAFVESSAEPGAAVVLVGNGAQAPYSYYATRNDLHVIVAARPQDAWQASESPQAWMVFSHTGDRLATAQQISATRADFDVAHFRVPTGPMTISANPVGVAWWPPEAAQAPAE